MRVAVIDDEQKERETLSGYLNRFESEYHKKIRIDVFESGDRFLETFGPEYDVIIFDVDMRGMNGLDCARKIREMDENVIILFVTNMAKYAVNGYEVDAIDYIIKPVGYYDFSLKFQKAVRRLSRKTEKSIMLEIGAKIHRVKVSDITYVEVLAHYVIYHLKNETFKLRGSMKEQELKLSAYNFSRIHKSYLVNLAYVENIQGNVIVVAGEQLPVGLAYKDVFMQDFLRFIRS